MTSKTFHRVRLAAISVASGAMVCSTVYPFVRSFDTISFSTAGAGFWWSWAVTFMLFAAIGWMRFKRARTWRNVRTINLALAGIAIGINGVMIRTGWYDYVVSMRTWEIISWATKMYVGWSALWFFSMVKPNDPQAREGEGR